MKTAVVIGTRPEIIKMSPVIRELEKRQADYLIIHTGQHYSYNMDRVFFQQLQLPAARYNLEVGSGSHAEQTARILTAIEKVYLAEKPDLVLVQGDTNTVLAGALAAAKLHISIGHVEAGLRSYDRQMPEEINRILTDHCADRLFAPTPAARDILLKEGIDAERVYLTGNTIVDAVTQNLEISSGSQDILETNSIKPSAYLLLTLHRQENVDDGRRFRAIIETLDRIALKYDLPVIFPIHPRSLKKMEEFQLKPQNIRLIDPVDYFAFLQLEKQARLVYTDSGGVQEECCILQTPCVTLRDNTERPETVEAGANLLVGASPDRIREGTEKMLSRTADWLNPFGDGRSAVHILDIVLNGAGG